jgi:NAD(P)-dependent dehydrogenase (short-subunit alcohol dehydrogenase family)
MTTIVITGANRGLGLALARQYAGDGAHVIAGCRHPDDADALRATGAEVHPLDMSSDESIDAFAAEVGDRPVDQLINNAGIDAKALGADDGERGPLDITSEQMRGVMNVNVVGPVHLVQVLAANVRAAHGKIANISSQVGSLVVAQRIGRDVSYNASKAALNMVTVKQSQVFKPDGVTVICIHPGWVRSDMGGRGADIEPSEAAASIAGVLNAVTIEHTGSFLNWDGTIHPW